MPASWPSCPTCCNDRRNCDTTNKHAWPSTSPWCRRPRTQTSGSLAPDADLRDTLGLDSLDFLSFIETLSERTGRRIDEDDYPQLATLASAVKFLADR